MQIHHLTNKSIAVTGLPEETRHIGIGKAKSGRLSLLYSPQDVSLTRSLKLPEGNWTILGRAAELTNDHWEEIVLRKSIYSGLIIFKYMDYVDPKWFRLDDALPSGHSLLKAEEVELFNTLILINHEPNS